MLVWLSVWLASITCLALSGSASAAPVIVASLPPRVSPPSPSPSPSSLLAPTSNHNHILNHDLLNHNNLNNRDSVNSTLAEVFVSPTSSWNQTSCEQDPSKPSNWTCGWSSSCACTDTNDAIEFGASLLDSFAMVDVLFLPGVYWMPLTNHTTLLPAGLSVRYTALAIPLAIALAIPLPIWHTLYCVGVCTRGTTSPIEHNDVDAALLGVLAPIRSTEGSSNTTWQFEFESLTSPSVPMYLADGHFDKSRAVLQGFTIQGLELIYVSATFMTVQRIDALHLSLPHIKLVHSALQSLTNWPGLVWLHNGLDWIGMDWIDDWIGLVTWIQTHKEQSCRTLRSSTAQRVSGCSCLTRK